MGAEYTEAQRQASKKYRQQKANIQLVCEPEQREELKQAAAAAGMSLSQFGIKAMYEKVDRDGLRQ